MLGQLNSWWFLAVAGWLAGGYIAAGVAKKNTVDRWLRFPQVLEHGEISRKPSEYDRKYVWIGWGRMITGPLGLLVVFFGSRADNEKGGFLWWNPIPWFSKK